MSTQPSSNLPNWAVAWFGTRINQFMGQKYLSFTAVSYDPTDVVSCLLAWFSLTPQVILIAQLTAFFLAETRRRRLQAGCLLAGQVMNETVNGTLKSIIRQPRPEGEQSARINNFTGSGRSDFGMPSSHAQFMGFLVVAAFVIYSTDRKNLKSIGKRKLHN